VDLPEKKVALEFDLGGTIPIPFAVAACALQL
jgi:hypothetical protein